MDINIETIKLNLGSEVGTYIRTTLEDKYGHYKFLTTLYAIVKKNNKEEYEVSLKMKPVKGKQVFVSAQNPNLNRALNECIQKLNVLIERYKEVHYHSAKTN